ncbi:MAG: flavodoxin [Candidatus Bathyarchaeia archaeon]
MPTLSRARPIPIMGMEKKNDGTKTLVVFYSKTGNTRLVAKAIARSLNADIEEIKDKKSRDGILGFLRSGYEAIFEKLSYIAPINENPAEYDLVIIGSPVWASRLSSPVRTYMSLHGNKIKKAAFFATCGMRSGKIFKQMRELIGSNSPIATLEVRKGEVVSGDYLKKIEDLKKKLSLKIE